MTVDEPDLLLTNLKERGFSSPAGIHWDEFRKLLVRQANNTAEDRFPPPLILAASIESDAVKFNRLREQINWAKRNGCLEQALDYLRSLDDSSWNRCPVEKWNEEHPWSKGDRSRCNSG